MTNGGWFNHYDDPDDDAWDDEPLTPTKWGAGNSHPTQMPAPVPPPPQPPLSGPEPNRVAPASPRTHSDSELPRTGPAPQHVNRKSVLVEVQCGLDGLPTAITLKSSWKTAFTPAQYGQSIMDSYYFAVQELVSKIVETGTMPPAAISSLRDAAPLLLRTRTHEEYTSLYNELFTQSVHTVYGPGRNRYGQPGLVVAAKPSRLISVTIDPDWAGTVDAKYIAQDIIDCCAHVRAQKPEVIRDTQLDHESDRELAARLVRHERTLLQNGI
ncbi:hypothetical protein [Nocardia sp. NPDC051750]|uniref:hypothetical protein n=1 Tax=Nocardia sp. NPDC051750 TaxID=3364325 RepID=UPI00379BF31F